MIEKLALSSPPMPETRANVGVLAGSPSVMLRVPTVVPAGSFSGTVAFESPMSLGAWFTMTCAVSVVAHRPGPLTRRSTPELGAQKYTGVEVGTVMIVPGGLMPVHAFVDVNRRTEPSGWMQSAVGPGQIATNVSFFGRQSPEAVAT